MGDVTLLLQRIDDGSAEAQAELIPLVYDELRSMAAGKLARESGALTLQPTALVHEAWLRLGGDAQTHWKNRRHFFGAAAESMRRILIDRARRHAAERHGGDWQRVEITEVLATPESAKPNERLVELCESLENLHGLDADKYELVKLRYFVGLSMEEIAATMGISLATAKRWWAFSRAWLRRDMEAREKSSGVSEAG